MQRRLNIVVKVERSIRLEVGCNRGDGRSPQMTIHHIAQLSREIGEGQLPIILALDGGGEVDERHRDVVEESRNMAAG